MQHRIAPLTDQFTDSIVLPINQAHQLAGFLFTADDGSVLNLPFGITVDCPKGHWKVWMNNEGRARFETIKGQLDEPMTTAQAMA